MPGRECGTGLAGQTVNEAVVFDFFCYVNALVDVDPGRRQARVEPGVICDDLRDAAAFHGRHSVQPGSGQQFCPTRMRPRPREHETSVRRTGMTIQRSTRASDQDRESVAEVLCGAYAAGCLDGSELEQRSSETYTAKTLGELQDLTADLPVWLLKRPAPFPYEHGYAHPPRRLRLEGSVGFMLAVAGFWLVVAAMAWVPPVAVPLTIMLTIIWLLLGLCSRGWPSRSSRRPQPRLDRPADPRGRR